MMDWAYPLQQRKGCDTKKNRMRPPVESDTVSLHDNMSSELAKATSHAPFPGPFTARWAIIPIRMAGHCGLYLLCIEELVGHQLRRKLWLRGHIRCDMLTHDERQQRAGPVHLRSVWK